MEVIYTGPWQQVATVVNQAAQEDVDCIGVSSLATDHLLVPKLMKALDEAGCRTWWSSLAVLFRMLRRPCCMNTGWRRCSTRDVHVKK